VPAERQVEHADEVEDLQQEPALSGEELAVVLSNTFNDEAGRRELSEMENDILRGSATLNVARSAAEKRRVPRDALSDATRV
jgi:hypothetical protein